MTFVVFAYFTTVSCRLSYFYLHATKKQGTRVVNISVISANQRLLFDRAAEQISKAPASNFNLVVDNLSLK